MSSLTDSALAHADHPPFRVAGRRVVPARNVVDGPEGEETLEPRVMGVLVCLADHAGEVVSREAFHATVWGDVIVGDDPLNRAISTIRRVFEDDARQPTVIETIRKVGYRLVAPVDTAPGSVPMTRAASRPARTRLWPATLGALAVVVLLALWAARSVTTAPPVIHPEPLTSLPGHEVDPDLAPDGVRVAYAWDGGEPGGPYRIYVRTLASPAALPLTDGNDRDPAWSPDGQWVAFVHRADGDCVIARVPSLGGRPQALAACDAAVDLAWSTSGRLAWADRAAPSVPYRIVVHDLDADTTWVLTQPPEAPAGERSSGDRYPAFSPDGQKVAFVRSEIAGLDRIYAVAVAGGTPHARSDAPQRIRQLAWPDPGTLVYPSDQDGPFALVRHDLGSGRTERLAGGGDGVQHPTAAGDRLVWEEREWDKNVWAHPLDGSAPRARLTSTRWDHSPAASSDGRVAFVSNRSGTYEVWLWDPDAAEAEKLTAFGGPVVGRIRWSPDGQRLAFDVRADGRSRVYVYDLAASRLTPAPRAEADALHPDWSPDGDSLYVASNRGGGWAIWRMPLAGGAWTRIGEGYAPVVSGGWLYTARSNTPGLWRQPLDGSAPAGRIYAGLAPSDNRNWTVSDGVVYAVGRTEAAADDAEDGAVLLRIATSGTADTLAVLARRVANLGLTVTPGGELLYVQVDRSDSDLMTASR